MVGYVLAKLDEDPTDGQAHGHITSLSVMRTHRRLGLAEKLMLQTRESVGPRVWTYTDGTERAMYETYGCKDVTLNVRMSNVAALALYKDTLGFTQAGTDLAYYGDKEDAYTMKKALDYLRDENLDGDSDDEPGLRSEGVDEGDAVGSEGKGNKSSGRTIKVGRPLGVGALVERNEASR